MYSVSLVSVSFTVVAKYDAHAGHAAICLAISCAVHQPSDIFPCYQGRTYIIYVSILHGHMYVLPAVREGFTAESF